MKTVTINIVKKSVMGVVEGLSATLAQHNPEVDFKAMWASDSEEKKLDIYYREAVTDLENEITKWLVSSTMQMDLQALADDYRMQLKVHTYWPSKLTGLLMNQIQNYLVHAVMAGWLNDFPEVKVSDYAGMGATDLEAIKEILLKKEFCFTEAARGVDNIGKEIAVSAADERAGDAVGKEAATAGAEARVSDGSEKEINSSSFAERSSDVKAKETAYGEASLRSSDGVGKNTSSANAEARSIDSSQKEVASSTAEIRERDELEKSVNNAETAGRSSDIDSKDSGMADVSSRSEDSDDKEAAYSEVSSRSQDHDAKEDNGTSAEVRETDNDQKEGQILSAEEREADNNQKEGQILHAEERETDGVDKLSKRGAETAERSKDEATQSFCHDFVDWSGGFPPFVLR